MAESVLLEPPEGVDAGLRPVDEVIGLWQRVDELPHLPQAAGLSGEAALQAAVAIARVRAAADALLAPYAARIEQLSEPGSVSRFARWKGFPSAAALLSHASGLSIGEASKLIGVGKVLADADAAVSERPALTVVGGTEEPNEDSGEQAPPLELVPGEPAAPPTSAPQTPQIAPLAAAVRAGTLGTEKITIIRRTLEDMTIDTAQVERMLVERAPELTIAQLRRLCLETLAQHDPQGHALREARQRRDRFIKFYEEPDGMVTVFGKLDAASAAPMKAWMEAELDAEVFAQRKRRPEEQRKVGQILADTFVTTFNHAMGCTKATTRPKTTLVVRMSKHAMESGEGWARCDGLEAPLTIGAALALAVDAEVVALLQGENGQPLACGRAKRSATRAQRLAVAERDQGCARCERAISKCDSHHIIEWGDGGPTNVENLVMLCISCHHILHEEGWGIAVENNQVWFIPPATVDPGRRRQPGSSARRAA